MSGRSVSDRLAVDRDADRAAVIAVAHRAPRGCGRSRRAPARSGPAVPGGGRSSSRASDEALRIAFVRVVVAAGDREFERVGLRVGNDDRLVVPLEELPPEELEGERRRRQPPGQECKPTPGPEQRRPKPRSRTSFAWRKRHERSPLPLSRRTAAVRLAVLMHPPPLAHADAHHSPKAMAIIGQARRSPGALTI